MNNYVEGIMANNRGAIKEEESSFTKSEASEAFNPI